MSELPTKVAVEGPALKKSKSISGSATPIPIPQTIVLDNKAASINPSSSETQEVLLNDSGRKVEDIIDGSNVRKFLNRTLTEYMVKGLHELVQKWENKEFEITSDDNESKAIVVTEFCNILKDLSQKDSQNGDTLA